MPHSRHHRQQNPRKDQTKRASKARKRRQEEHCITGLSEINEARRGTIIMDEARQRRDGTLGRDRERARVRGRLAKASDLVPDPSQDRAVPTVDERARPSIYPVYHNISTFSINVVDNVLKIAGEGGARRHFT